METVNVSVVGPEDLVDDLISQLREPDSGAESVERRQPPPPERAGAAGEPFTIILGAATVVLATDTVIKATTKIAKVVKRWFAKRSPQALEKPRSECELLIRAKGEEHRIVLKAEMSEEQIAETFGDLVE